MVITKNNFTTGTENEIASVIITENKIGTENQNDGMVTTKNISTGTEDETTTDILHDGALTTVLWRMRLLLSTRILLRSSLLKRT